jgi:tellurite resistance protein
MSTGTFDGDELQDEWQRNLENPAMREYEKRIADKKVQWIKQIETYCKEQGIEPTELIEFHKKNKHE